MSYNVCACGSDRPDYLCHGDALRPAVESLMKAGVCDPATAAHVVTSLAHAAPSAEAIAGIVDALGPKPYPPGYVTPAMRLASREKMDRGPGAEPEARAYRPGEPTEEPPMSAVAHLAGRCLTAHGRHRRQRCEWCGIALLEDDLSRMMGISSAGAPAEPLQWEPGTWVEIEEGNPRRMSTLAGYDDKMPDHSCMALELDLLELEAKKEA